MSFTGQPTLLATHTLESLCAELAGGREVQTGANAQVFSFASAETRSIFQWYRQNRPKWSSPNRKEDVEAIVDCAAKAPPSIGPFKPAEAHPGRTLFPRLLRAHRFAGLHRYGSPGVPPPDFEFVFSAPMVIVEGTNGSGKTSLINAITWCLTGHVYRPQRLPEAVEAIDLSIAGQSDGPNRDEITDDDGNAIVACTGAAQDMTGITPLPEADVLRELGAEKLPLDTWVEIEFVGDDGAVAGTIRRSLSRNSRGSPVVSEPDFSRLALDPLSREVGTRMPGALPYIHPGGKSDFGQAVATLTGLRPLRDLVVHARKTKEKLQNDLPNDRRKELKDLGARYDADRREFEQIVESAAELQTIPKPSSFREASLLVLNTLSQTIDNRISSILKAAESDLATEVNVGVRADLAKNVGPASGLLEDEHVDKLVAQVKLCSLAALTDNDFQAVEGAIARTIEELRELDELGKMPSLASRRRLYARVARWLREETVDAAAREVEECPVCITPLADKLDPVSKNHVAEHLVTAVRSGAQHIEETFIAWERSRIKALRSELPVPVCTLIDGVLPRDPWQIISQAVDELFAAPQFSGALAVMRTAAVRRLDQLKAAVPPYVPQSSIEIPTGDLAVAASLKSLIQGARTTVAQARWIRAHGELIQRAVRLVVGTCIDDSISLAAPSPREVVARLRDLLNQTEPLKRAGTQLQRLSEHLVRRDKIDERLVAYQTTARAIEPLLGIDRLVDEHTGALISALSAETNRWKESLYMPACSGSPSLCGSDVGSDGVLHMRAAANGTAAGAQHILNASELRAALLGFLFALHAEVIRSRGGLALFLLDDIQELFDAHNRRRIADAACRLALAQTQIVLTTNDESFRRTLTGAAKAMSLSVDQRRVSPPIKGRDVLVVAECVESIQQKRALFNHPENVNNHGIATAYANSARMFLECILAEFLAEAASPAAPKATLSDFIGQVSSARQSGVDAFQGGAITRLVKWRQWESGSDFMAVINQAHHGAGVKYEEVKRVDSDIHHAMDLVNASHHEYVLWLKRVPPERSAARPESPAALPLSPKRVPMWDELAAFTLGSATSDQLAECGVFSLDSLGEIGVYWLGSWNFGFAARRHWRVIVSLNDNLAQHGDLVIALRGNSVYARRLHVDPIQAGKIALSSEAEDPRRRPPTLFFDRGDVRLLRVIGVLFDKTAFYTRASDEAILEDGYKGLERIEVAFRVRGESAEPVALDGQYVLGGTMLSAHELERSEGEIVAVIAERMSVLKRVGGSVRGLERIRQLEAIGGRGDSLLIRVAELERDPLNEIPLLHSARRVLGVLYDVPI